MVRDIALAGLGNKDHCCLIRTSRELNSVFPLALQNCSGAVPLHLAFLCLKITLYRTDNVPVSDTGNDRVLGDLQRVLQDFILPIGVGGSRLNPLSIFCGRDVWIKWYPLVSSKGTFKRSWVTPEPWTLGVCVHVQARIGSSGYQSCPPRLVRPCWKDGEGQLLLLMA